jgi:hypothetical protein
MSSDLSLSSRFNRAVLRGRYFAAAFALSAGLGFGVSSYLDQGPSSLPPVQNAAMHQIATKNLVNLADEIIDAQKTLHDGNSAAQDARLHAYRKEVLVNPAFSEKEALEMYMRLSDRAEARGMKNVAAFFPAPENAFAYRDETLAALKLPADAKQVSDAEADRLLKETIAADRASNAKENTYGAGTGGGLLFGMLSLSAIGFFRRRREEARERLEAELKKPPVFEPLPGQTPDAKPNAPLKKTFSI